MKRPVMATIGSMLFLAAMLSWALVIAGSQPSVPAYAKNPYHPFAIETSVRDR